MPRDTLASLKEQRDALAREKSDLLEALTLAQKPITDMTDTRLTPVWDKAHEAANDAGHCSEFDEIMENMEAPGRKRDTAATIYLRGDVRNQEEYIERLQKWFRESFPRIFPDLHMDDFEWQDRS